METLKNNHESMKTVVETFLIEETIDLIHNNEELDKWNKHVEELGLKGQTKIIQKHKSPIPFMHLKKSYQNICRTLCPRAVELKEYDITPIPVEILDLVGLSLKESYFSKIQIWYDDKSPDPFCIGIAHDPYVSYNEKNSHIEKSKGKHKSKMTAEEIAAVGDWTFSDSYANFYLIGKWADVKQSWEQLKERAVNRFKNEKKNELQKEIKQAQRNLEDLDQLAFDQFN